MASASTSGKLHPAAPATLARGWAEPHVPPGFVVVAHEPLLDGGGEHIRAIAKGRVGPDAGAVARLPAAPRRPPPGARTGAPRAGIVPRLANELARLDAELARDWDDHGGASDRPGSPRFASRKVHARRCSPGTLSKASLRASSPTAQDGRNSVQGRGLRLSTGLRRSPARDARPWFNPKYAYATGKLGPFDCLRLMIAPWLTSSGSWWARSSSGG